MVVGVAMAYEQDGDHRKNCAAGGLQFVQVFSSTSSVLGLSRSCDYSCVNGNMNAMIMWRRATASLQGQANLWGEIMGTGLAGSGSGSAGRHGDTGAGHGASENAEVRDPFEGRKQDILTEMPPEYYQREAATADFVVAHKDMTNAVEITHKIIPSVLQAEGWEAVRGLQVAVKTRGKDDKVLLICNLPASTSDNHDGVSWTFKRGGYFVGPQFSNWTHELGRADNVLMPWLDEPGKAKLELDYTVNCRLKGSVHLSRDAEHRQVSAITIPGGQVTSARSHEKAVVEPGRWHDVPGMQQISVTNQGEKVLVVCTIKYTALWTDEMTRGRFTILRDGTGLDTEGYGLQSVRSLEKNVKRTAVMALVDDPPTGPHLYAAKAAVSTENGEVRVCSLDDDDRQLMLIRLPPGHVAGPSRCLGQTLVEEDQWTEISGLSVTVTVAGKHDKVLVVYNTNFDPHGLNYEAYFTIFRRTDQGAVSKNLGSESQGMCSVASSSVGSSEYPVGMFVDAPGAGTFTYTVHARTRRCDHLTEPTSVEVGPDGQIAVVPLGPQQSGNLMEEMAKEMAIA